jgi:hypothetical protein
MPMKCASFLGMTLNPRRVWSRRIKPGRIIRNEHGQAITERALVTR